MYILVAFVSYMLGYCFAMYSVLKKIEEWDEENEIT